jgi:putative salt-induced outer membrane protein YdiY
MAGSRTTSVRGVANRSRWADPVRLAQRQAVSLGRIWAGRNRLWGSAGWWGVLCALGFAAGPGLGGTPAATVVLHLRNGDQLGGSILSETTNQVTLLTRWKARIVVPADQIVRREGLASPPAKATSPPKAKKTRHWKVNVSLGASAVYNQTRSELYTADARLAYTLGRLKESLQYQASYGVAQRVTSVNRMLGTEKTDFDLGKQRRYYAYNEADAGYDQLLKIDLQYGEGPGLGYHLIGGPQKPNAKFALNLEAGGKYQRFNYTGGTHSADLYLRLAENATWHLPAKATLTESLAFLPRAGSLTDYQVRLDSTLAFPLSSHLSLNLNVGDFYNTQPGPGASRNSLQIDSTVGLQY